MKEIDSLNIAHIVFSFDFGGLERRILRLIESLSSRGCRFLIVSLRPSDGRFLDMNYPVTHLNVNARPGLDLGAIRRVAAALRQNNTHIVHTHNWVSMLEGTLAAKLAGTLVSVHGEHGAKRFEQSELVWRRTVAQKLLCRLSDHIIPVNDSINERLQEVWGLTSERLTTIRNGVDTSKFRPRRTNTMDQKQVIRIGSISRLDPVKNFPCLIRAIAKLHQSQSALRYHLTIVGDGDEKEKLMKLAHSLGVSEHMHLAGATENAEDWYGKFDIYVNSSFSEGMSNTVLEAMACGLPIVVSDVPGHRDWLEQNKHALFFESDHEESLAANIKKLSENLTLRANISSTNRTYIEESFSQERFITNYTNLYRGLINTKGYDFKFKR